MTPLRHHRRMQQGHRPGRCFRGNQSFVQGQFRGCGYRMTKPREAIIEVLRMVQDPLSAEDIYFRVHKIYSDIGLTTVYRNLELLVSMQLVNKFDFGHGCAKYELSDKNPNVKHHHHLICTVCNRVISYCDFMDQELKYLKETEKGLAKKYQFDIKDHVIQFYGLCKSCQKKERR